MANIVGQFFRELERTDPKLRAWFENIVYPSTDLGHMIGVCERSGYQLDPRTGIYFKPVKDLEMPDAKAVATRLRLHGPTPIFSARVGDIRGVVIHGSGFIHKGRDIAALDVSKVDTRPDRQGARCIGSMGDDFVGFYVSAGSCFGFSPEKGRNLEILSLGTSLLASPERLPAYSYIPWAEIYTGKI